MNDDRSGAPRSPAPRALLAETMLRDRRRLQRELDRLSAAQVPDDAAMAAWQRRAEGARARYAARAASVPAIAVDDSLPIAARSDDIVALIRKHPVIVLAGETGSGKSTQLPKLCLAAGRGVSGLIEGNARQLLLQFYGVVVTLLWSGAVTFVLLKLVGAFVALRVSRESELEGLDITQHGEALQ